ncbi:vesicle-associated membrane protein-associated protein B isoform X2 [Lepeophtheirus salmonis]|uniref:Vesicle-associated membrane protein-associated protein B n=1 Tax=Lepeophtheirus salmonis TaxID=72036 RepID=C1BVF6_LEPSM|nr:vesicle-associated membrane protein-associated protein B-like isoform X2 [Lepeophtheirus salmonis]XP_040567363.1 vesicle-associated membrane protein-associated protein B-like isoform X2 [Lepeophtheirus salmonis]ACO13009.1 Vesicle-associated membrane protein-associated protein B [Lepeophtheirus salmonis]
MEKFDKPPKPEQVLIIQPSNELEFVGPFNRPVTRVMSLTNPTDSRVCFKIKTTAPKKYCVKPNSGIVDPKKCVSISVGLQPFDYDPSERNKHKFMVQSMFAPDGYFNMEDLWKEANGNNLMDSKLRCLFTCPTEPDSVTSSEKLPEALPTEKVVSSSSVSSAKSNDNELKRSVDEIKKLQEEISSIRQENICVKEEMMRQKRLASNNEVESSTPSSFVVRSESPEQNSLTTTYIYLALIMFLIGFIIGKWII